MFLGMKDSGPGIGFGEPGGYADLVGLAKDEFIQIAR